MRKIVPFLPIVVVVILMITAPQVFSLALLPIVLCGVLSLNNMMETTRERSFLVNPYFYTWLFVFISTFIAPLIHLCRNYWMPNNFPHPQDWSGYAFVTSSMYLVGILIWMIIFKHEPQPFSNKSEIRVLKKNWKLWLFVFLFISLIAQLYVYWKMGGVSGYIRLYSERTDDYSAFAGMGLFFILSESFPYILLIFLVYKYRNRQIRKLKFFMMLLLLLVVTLFFGGLRGSRSNTVLFMVISVVAFDTYVYKVRMNDFVVLLVGFFVFMFIGRLYKDYGVNMFAETTSKATKNYNMNSTELTVIGDLARYDVNAYQLFMMQEVRPDYALKYGETYLWGLFTFTPGGKYVIRAFGLEGRSSAAAELFYGSSEYKNSRILGPIGEWFINFGRYTFFIAYFLVGYALRYIRKFTQSISADDVRFMMVPSLMIFIPQLILSDFSNICFYFVKRVLVVAIVLYVISRKSYVTE